MPDLRIPFQQYGCRGEGGRCLQVFPEGVLRIAAEPPDRSDASEAVVVVVAEFLHLGILPFRQKGGDESHEILTSDDVGDRFLLPRIAEGTGHLQGGEVVGCLLVVGIEFEDGTAGVHGPVVVAGLAVDVHQGYEGGQGGLVGVDSLPCQGGCLGGTSQ